MSNIPPISDPNPSPSAPAPGARKKSGLSPEAREWLGITTADFLIYAAIIGAASLYFLVNVPAELLISLVSLGVGAVSCVLGMKTNPELSRFTNAIKIIGHVVGMLVVVFFVAVNFFLWNPKPQTPFFPQWSQFQ